MFCNLFVYQLLQPRLYLLPFSVEHSFHHGFLLIEESHIICGEFVGCLLFFGEWHSLFLFFCCKYTTKLWKGSCHFLTKYAPPLVIFFQQIKKRALKLAFLSISSSVSVF